MNSVLGFTELLKNMDLTKEARLYIDNIHTSGHSLLNLINDILDLSKVEAGKLDLQYKSVSLKQLFHEMFTVFSHKAKEKGLHLQIDFSDDVPEFLILDETRLRQVLVNLISNALKFSGSGAIVLTAKCSSHGHSTTDIFLSVQDSGEGIPLDQQSRIFEAFAQRSGQKTADYGGTGLGLSISMKLIEMMGGSLELNSQPGCGSTFTIKIPQVEIAAGIPFEQKVSSDRDIMQIEFDPAKILIADDIDINRVLLRNFLSAYPFELCEAENGVETLEKAQEFKPDIILLDMKMPKMDGYETARILQQDKKYEGIKVIAVTASALKKDEGLILKLCDAYLRKPVSRHDLIHTLTSYLPHRQKPVIAEKSEKASSQKLKAAQLKELIKQLKYQVPITQELQHGLLMGQTIDFAHHIQELRDKYPHNELIDYYDHLQSAIDSFDNEAIKHQLREFPHLVEKLAG